LGRLLFVAEYTKACPLVPQSQMGAPRQLILEKLILSSMDVLKFIQSIEEFIYEVLLLLVLIPKTLKKVILNPEWIYTYVQGEIVKKDEIKFNRYVSPLLLFVLIVAIPPAYLAYSDSSGISNYPWLKAIDRFITPSVGAYALCIALYLLIYPLIISMLIYNKHFKVEVDKANNDLKAIFYSQCYCFVPTHLLALVIHVWQMRNVTSDQFNDGIMVISYCLIIPWVLWREIIILKTILQKNSIWATLKENSVIFIIAFSILSIPYIAYLIIHIFHGNTVEIIKPFVEPRLR
jgi:hypothetical protein